MLRVDDGARCSVGRARRVDQQQTRANEFLEKVNPPKRIFFFFFFPSEKGKRTPFGARWLVAASPILGYILYDSWVRKPPLVLTATRARVSRPVPP